MIVAYVCQADAPLWLKTHFRVQIRTFWIGLLYLAIAGVAVLMDAHLVGASILILALVWIVVRCVIGLKTVSANQPYQKPESWLW
jgi:uncharacterized membrane protein